MRKFVASGSGFGSCQEGPRPLHAVRLVIGLGAWLLASMSAQVCADPDDPCQFQRQQRRMAICRRDAQRQHPVWDGLRRRRQ